MLTPVQIDIFFDLICPWCFIGKHRMERALADRPGRPVELRWLPFQLNPGMPTDGMDRDEYLAAKFGGPDRAEQIYAMVAETAKRDGMAMDLDGIERTPNTLDAHRLVRYFAARGASAAEATDAIFRAYFQQCRDIGDRAVLADIGAELGHDRGAVAEHLDGDADVSGVRGADAAARRLGIQAVPCFVFDRRYALSGAQDPESFYPMFDLAEVEPATSHR